MFNLMDYRETIAQTNSVRDLYLMMDQVCNLKEADSISIGDYNEAIGLLKLRIAELVAAR
jgi:hypothetical protein